MDDRKAGAVESLCRAWEGSLPTPQTEREWPAAPLDACRRHGYFSWFAPAEFGGQQWSSRDLLETYLALARVSLTPTFILTQRAAAVDRLVQFASPNLRQRLLPSLIRGDALATVGISHLTTSRQHLTQPPLLATPVDGGWSLTGETPWVTGAVRADWLVVGAATESREQLLVAIESSGTGVDIQPPLSLMGLSGSLTGAVRFEGARLPSEQVLVGPQPDVMTSGLGSRTGGLQTSALALGHAGGSIAFLRGQAAARSELRDVAEALGRECDQAREWLLELADGAETEVTAESLRQLANDLVVRAAQSALVAAKGAGFVAGHPVERWCRESIFFLVWSCPQRVLMENLRQWTLPESGGFC